MMEALVEWTAVFVVNAAWQIPAIAAASFAALALIRRPHPQTEYILWGVSLVASVVLPAWAASRVALGRSAQVSVDAPWIAAELVVLVYWGSVVIAVCFFLRSWYHVHVLRRLPAAVPPSDMLPKIAETSATALGIPTPEVKICDIPAPATVGGRRPIVLLPRCLALQRRETVLIAAVAHEVAHISRRDFRVNFWLELISVAIAVHPVTHWIKARLRASREKACDAVVAERVLNSRDYARSIVTFVSSLSDVAPVRLAPGVVDAGDLTARIRTLLDRRSRATSTVSRCGFALVAVAFLLTGWFSAQWLRPRMPDLSVALPKPPKPPPPPSRMFKPNLDP